MTSPPAATSHQPVILIFVPHTLRTTARSGIQRVVVSLAAQLALDAQVELATWDEVDGSVRFCNRDALVAIFGDAARPALLQPNCYAQAVGRRFQDLVLSGRDVCMILPEISYHLPDGWSIYQRVITQCLEAGWPTVAVLYDLIPILNPGYTSMREDHERYIAQLLRCDLIVAISEHVEAVFRGYLAERLNMPPDTLLAAGTRIATIALPGVAPVSNPRGAATSARRADNATAKDQIAVLGTIERRKQQLRVVRCYKKLLEAGTVKLPMQIIGSLHADVAAEFMALIADEPRIRYSGYMTDSEVDEAFRRARFSVFASDDEGFGLPISESLSHGTPCLTANFGAMHEVARDGGCLTVDVRQDKELSRGLAALATDDRLVARLRAEIGRRPHRGWNDYVVELLDLLRQGRRPPDMVQRLRTCLTRGKPIAAGRLSLGSPAVVFVGQDGAKDPGTGALRVTSVTDARAPLPVAQCLEADVLLLAAPRQLDDLIGAVDRDAGLGALPGWIDASGDVARASELLNEAVTVRTRQTVIALRERNFATALARFAHPFPQRILSIVISTYNRALFVSANAAWIVKQIQSLGRAIELVVVDNASKDDTGQRLSPFRNVPNVRIVINPTNVGMLGNLRVCSSLLLAEHVWLIGDDDFIVPDMLHRLLRLLTVQRAVPLVLMNFGVYHRAVMSPGDSATRFIAERQVLAPNPAPSGPMRVIDAGSQHDNLFTAIYPIIFRADLAAAVFNHAFEGKPFRSLVESVPTTKFILESYAQTEVQWIAEVCVVGNAHNSWQRYRVPWHAVLMPLALRLARRCGMDAHMLRRWANVHLGLYEEAARLFPTPGLAADFETDALVASQQVLRQRLPLDAALLQATQR